MKEYNLKNNLQYDSLNIHVDKSALNGNFHLHTHDYCELFFIVSGRGKHFVEDVEYTLKEGDIFVIKGHEKHAILNACNLVYFNIMFRVHDLQLDDCKDLPGFWLLFVHEQHSNFLSYLHVEKKEYQTILDWCELLLSEYTNHQPGYIAVCHSVLIQMVVFLSRSCQILKYHEQIMTTNLTKAVVYMQTNFEKKITVDELALMTGFSKRHFSRVFQQIYHMPPLQFLNEIRLDHAYALLKTKKYKITEVALLCGFHDSNYFSKVFKHKYQKAPSDLLL